MKIKNSQGVSVTVPKEHEAAIKKAIQLGDHEKVSAIVAKCGTRMAQNGTGLAGPVLRSGPNRKNSPPPSSKVTKAPSHGQFVNSTFPMALGGYNRNLMSFGLAGNGLMVGPYQDGGQMQGDPNQQVQAPQMQQPQQMQQGAPQQSQDPKEQAVMQLMDEAEKALQQGASPKDVIKTLVKEGVPKKTATQIVEQVVQQAQQAPAQSQGNPDQQMQQSQGAPAQGAYGLRMKQMGGGDDQMTQAIGQALQQGQDPKKVMQMLIQKGMKPDQAQQMVQQVMQQMQQPQGPMQGAYGLRMAQQGTGPMVGGTVQNQPIYNFQDPNDQFPAMNQMGQGAIQGQNPNPQFTPDLTPRTMEGAFKSAGLTNQVQQPLYTGNFYVDRSLYAGARGQQLGQQSQIDSFSTDPATRKQGLQMARQAKGYGILGDTSAGQAVMQGAENIAGVTGRLFSDAQARKQEMQQQYYNNTRNRFLTEPYQGLNTQPAFSQFGGKYPRGKLEQGYSVPYGTHEFALGGMPIYINGGIYQNGGIPTEGSDFKSGAPNVMTEKGETIADPTQGPAGVVVHDQTGDNHSDPSGGNAYQLGADAVVHSKVLGIKVGDFLELAKDYPQGDFITKKVAEKFKDPNKEVSYAKLAALFDTKKLAEEVEAIGKKAENIEKKDIGNQATKVTQTTQELNKKTLASQLQMKKQEMAQNTEAAGANGPLHGVAEGLKMAGAYGAKVQRETQQTAQGNPPTAGEGIKMKGKKLLLPKAQTGATVDDNYYGQVQPTVTQPVVTPPVQAQPPLKVAQQTFTDNPRIAVDQPAQTFPEKTSTGFTYGAPNQYDWLNWQRELDQSAQSRGFQVPIWNPNSQASINKAYQEQSYDDALDTPEGRRALAVMWEQTGETQTGPKALDKDGKPIDVKGLTSLNDKDLVDYLNRLRPNYIEGNLDYRKVPYITPRDQAPSDVVNNQGVDISKVKATSPYIADQKKLLYSEGLHPDQIAGDLAAIFERRDPAPYIENLGAKRGLQDLTKQQFPSDWAARNANYRDFRALTQYNPQNTPAIAAQHAANLWTAQNELSSKTAERQAEIQKKYEDQRVGLQEAAGKNKAEALNLLAERTAKVRSAASDRTINALSDIGEKTVKNLAVQRASRANQQVFQNVGWNPWENMYNVAGGNDVLSALALQSGTNTGDLQSLKEKLMQAQTDENEARALNFNASERMTLRKLLGIGGPKPGQYQMGGKIKRVPKKMMRSSK